MSSPGEKINPTSAPVARSLFSLGRKGTRIHIFPSISLGYLLLLMLTIRLALLVLEKWLLPHAESESYLRQILPKFKPDLIIWGYVSNDPDEKMINDAVNYEKWGRYKKELESSDRFSLFVGKLRTLFPYLVKLVLDMRFNKLVHDNPPPPEAGLAYSEWELQLLRGANFEQYKVTVGEVSEFIRSSGIPQFFVTLPTFPSYTYFHQRQEPVLELFRKKGIRIYDLLPLMGERFTDDHRPVLFSPHPILKQLF